MRYFVAVLQIALLFVQAIPKAIDPDAAAPSLERHAEGGVVMASFGLGVDIIAAPHTRLEALCGVSHCAADQGVGLVDLPHC
jgi:hypothetical protein